MTEYAFGSHIGHAFRDWILSVRPSRERLYREIGEAMAELEYSTAVSEALDEGDRIEFKDKPHG